MANGILGPMTRPDNGLPNQTVVAYGSTLSSAFCQNCTFSNPVFLNTTNDLGRFYDGNVGTTCTQSPASGQLAWCKDHATDASMWSYGDTFKPGTRTIASGTSALTSGSVGGATCQTAVTTTATGTATTDVISWAYATAPTLATDALLHVSPYVTSGNVNFTRCNPTAGSITGTAIVINWKVVR